MTFSVKTYTFFLALMLSTPALSKTKPLFDEYRYGQNVRVFGLAAFCGIAIDNERYMILFQSDNEGDKVELARSLDGKPSPLLKTNISGIRLVHRTSFNNDAYNSVAVTSKTDKGTAHFNGVTVYNFLETSYRTSIEVEGKPLPIPIITRESLGGALQAFQKCYSDNDLYLKRKKG